MNSIYVRLLYISRFKEIAIAPILINFQHLVEVAGVARSLAAGLETLSWASTADAAITRKPRPVSKRPLRNTFANFLAAARQRSRRLNALVASIFFSSHQQSDWPPGIYCLRRKLVPHFIASQRDSPDPAPVHVRHSCDSLREDQPSGRRSRFDTLFSRKSSFHR